MIVSGCQSLSKRQLVWACAFQWKWPRVPNEVGGPFRLRAVALLSRTEATSRNASCSRLPRTHGLFATERRNTDSQPRG